MRNKRGGTMVVDLQTNPYNHYHHHHRRPKFGDILRSNQGIFSSGEDTKNNHRHRRCDINSASTMSSTTTSGDSSPTAFSPWAQVSSPAMPWMRTNSSSFNQHFNDDIFEANGLIGSIAREEGHIYSLAAYGDLLYTGSDSKNIRVWKNLRDYSGFKSTSGLVKDIVIYGDRIFTGHQDGKIRVWRVSSKKPGKHKRVGSLPKFKDVVKSTINPKHLEFRRKNKNMVKVRHYDAVSCLSLNEEFGLLYSTSWDRTLKVWRISDSKCLESIDAHDDAINSVVAGFDSLVFTGSADGTVKVWKRELQGKGTRHFLVQVLLKQENAVTALAVNLTSAVIYCGSSDGLVNYWEREKHLSHGGALRGHKLAVLCLATAGNLLMSGSADKNICVWRRNSGGGHVCLSVLTGHMGPVKCLAVEEERRRRRRKAAEEEEKGPGSRRWIVYSGSLDKSVKVWQVSEHAPTWREMDAPGSSGPRSSSSPPGGEKGKLL